MASGKVTSLNEAAAILGIHRNTLAKWLESEGCPFVTRADRSRGIEWQIRIADVVTWQVERARSEALASIGSEDGAMSKEEAERRRTIAKMVEAEIGTAELLHEVVSRHDVAGDMASFALALRNNLTNLCAKLASRAAGMNRAADIQDLAETEMNKAFTSALAELVERWPDASPDAASGA